MHFWSEDESDDDIKDFSNSLPSLVESNMVKSASQVFQDQLKPEWKKLTVVALPTTKRIYKATCE